MEDEWGYQDQKIQTTIFLNKKSKLENEITELSKKIRSYETITDFFNKVRYIRNNLKKDETLVLQYIQEANAKARVSLPDEIDVDEDILINENPRRVEQVIRPEREHDYLNIEENTGLIRVSIKKKGSKRLEKIIFLTDTFKEGPNFCYCSDDSIRKRFKLECYEGEFDMADDEV